MKSTLRTDLRRLQSLAFHRAEWGADLVRRIHRLHKTAKAHPDFATLDAILPWLFVPLTLWPIHLEGLGHHVADAIESGRRLDQQIALLLSLLGPTPDSTAVAVAMKHENDVQAGDYGTLIHAQHKFDFMEQELRGDPEFIADWQRLKAAFDIKCYQDRKQIIRRRMSPERNFRVDWRFEWRGQRARFQSVFDVFCWRWYLYGMRGDEPLLMKVTVNLTPYGTMILIPAYWSFDPKRDLKWRAITALHRGRGVRQQGPKLSQIRASNRDDAERARELFVEATAKGLTGKQRNFAVMREMGWHPATDPSKLRRLLKLSPNQPPNEPSTTAHLYGDSKA